MEVVRRPKQNLATVVWHDMVDCICWGDPSLLLTHDAKRVLVEMMLGCFAPTLAVIESGHAHLSNAFKFYPRGTNPGNPGPLLAYKSIASQIDGRLP